MTPGTRADALMLLVLGVFGLVGGLLTGDWLSFIAIGAGCGSILGYVVRRRAGLPDRSLYGRLRHRRSTDK